MAGKKQAYTADRETDALLADVIQCLDESYNEALHNLYNKKKREADNQKSYLDSLLQEAVDFIKGVNDGD